MGLYRGVLLALLLTVISAAAWAGAPEQHYGDDTTFNCIGCGTLPQGGNARFGNGQPGAVDNKMLRAVIDSRLNGTLGSSTTLKNQLAARPRQQALIASLSQTNAAALTRNALQAFAQKAVGPRNVVRLAARPFDSSALIAAVQTRLAAVQAESARRAAALPPYQGGGSAGGLVGVPQGACVDGGTNSLQTIIDDMALMNEGPLRGVNPNYGWARGPGMVVMGNDPRLINTPDWFDRSIAQIDLYSYWSELAPWYVFFEGEGNTSTNARVQMRNYQVWYQSRTTGQWTQLMLSNGYDGHFCPAGSNYAGCSGGDDIRAESSGGMSFGMRPGNVFHGWQDRGVTLPAPGDIAALWVTTELRLTPQDPSNPDLSGAQYLAHVGADYWPPAGASAFGNNANPGAGVSRAKYITPEWRSFNMLTFSDVGTQYPGGGVSRAEFLASPPPQSATRGSACQ